jgi:putative intracellular protease/amidase
MNKPVLAALAVLIPLIALPDEVGAVERVRYVCPPCGMPCDTLSFAAPGECEGCHMVLVAQAGSSAASSASAPAAPSAASAAPAAAPGTKRAAILIYPGVQIIDFTGPYEVFGQARFDVYTVAASREPVTTSMDMRVIPEYTFADCPPPDVLIVPGGNADPVAADVTAVDWVRRTAADAGYTMSVCNGAFIIAKAGLLDGATATTFYGLLEELKTAAPRTTVVNDQRFVDNGRVITTAGLSSGIDGSLHLVSKMLGMGRAQEIALNMEYDWRPDSRYARAALADRLIPRIRVEEVTEAHVLSTEGTREAWQKTWSMKSDLNAADLVARLGKALATEAGWKPGTRTAPLAARPDVSGSGWSFVDASGRTWNGELTVLTSENGPGLLLVRLAIARAG